MVSLTTILNINDNIKALILIVMEPVATVPDPWMNVV